MHALITFFSSPDQALVFFRLVFFTLLVCVWSEACEGWKRVSLSVLLTGFVVWLVMFYPDIWPDYTTAAEMRLATLLYVLASIALTCGAIVKSNLACITVWFFWSIAFFVSVHTWFWTLAFGIVVIGLFFATWEAWESELKKVQPKKKKSADV